MARKKSKKPRDKTIVALYLHFGELRDCLQSGWAATATREYLIERFGPEGVPSERSIQRWREHHLDSTARIVPHEVIEKKLKGIDFKVDVIAHLSRLIKLLEDRIGAGIALEDSSGGMILPTTERAVDSYLQVIDRYVKVAQDMGIMKARPQVPLIDARSVNIDAETMATLRETIREIRLIEQQSRQGAGVTHEKVIKESQKTTEEVVIES